MASIMNFILVGIVLIFLFRDADIYLKGLRLPNKRFQHIHDGSVYRFYEYSVNMDEHTSDAPCYFAFSDDA